uniref:Mannosyltransferase n=1 Tax=Macrostomum lignano TaxID=282301 RepID=A0A1I8FL95_9PLAT
MGPHWRRGLAAVVLLRTAVVHMMVQPTYSANHVYRLYNDYGGYTMDITGPLMILTQKLSSLLWPCTNGGIWQSAAASGAASLAGAIGWTNCHPYWTNLAYSYYLPTLMAGPHVFYSDFIAHFKAAHTNSNEDKQYLNRAVLRALACTGLYSFLVLDWDRCCLTI